MDVKEEDILGADIAQHWYYISKGRALRDMLGGVVVDELLDVGAGSGVFSKQLLEAGLARRAVCVDPAYTAERLETHRGHEIEFVRSAAQSTPELILMMDVLEHVDDDVGLLRSYTESLSGSGRVLITVPAFQFLWSGHDVFLEHRRRYTRRSLHRCVQAAGLEVKRSRYFYGLLFPAVTAMRLMDRLRAATSEREPVSALKKHSALVNRVLTSVHDVERHTLFPINALAGLSIFCLAGKPR